MLMPLVATRAQEMVIPQGTRMMLRLQTPLSSRHNQPGDPFTARVIDPPRYEGAVVQGHIAGIEPSGRFSGRTEMQLAFDSIELRHDDRAYRDADTEFTDGDTDFR